MTEDLHNRWLLLVLQLPAQPSNARVKTWRRLQQLGAISVKNSVYVLPNSAQAVEDFEWLRSEIQGMKGQASIFTAAAVNGVEERDIVEAFQSARAEDYRQFRQLLTRSKSGRNAGRGTDRMRTLRQLREQLSAIRQIDFFAAPGADEAERALSALERVTAPAGQQQPLGVAPAGPLHHADSGPARRHDAALDLDLGKAAVGGGNDDIEEHEYIDVTTPPQESYVSDPPDGKIPYTPWALAKRNEIRAGLARGWPGETGQRLYGDPAALCLVGMPRWSFGAQQILQKPGSVIMLTANTYRVIPTAGRPHIDPSAKFFFGNARGRWEGETLVVDVTGVNGETWLDSAGNFYSPNTRMIERWTMVDANTIDYEITIEDPTIYTRPWKMNYPKRRAGNPTAAGAAGVTGGATAIGAAGTVRVDPYAKEAWEQTCHEGNADNLEILKKLGFKWFAPVAPPN